jgi:hypothetical protein
MILGDQMDGRVGHKSGDVVAIAWMPSFSSQEMIAAALSDLLFEAAAAFLLHLANR